MTETLSRPSAKTTGMPSIVIPVFFIISEIAAKIAVPGITVLVVFVIPGCLVRHAGLLGDG